MKGQLMKSRPVGWEEVPPLVPVWGHRNLLHLITAVGSGEPKAVTPEDAVDPTEIYGRVAVIPVVGPLWGSPWFGRLYWCSWRPRMADLEAAVRKAAANDQVETIFLYVRSWGGEFPGLLDLADAVFEARSVKSVVAFVEDYACSAAYLVAAQAEKIVINRGAEVGNLGLYSVLIDTSKEDQIFGIKVVVVSSGGLKGEGARSEVSEALIADTQRLVDDQAALFFATVRRGRGWTPETLQPLMDGRTHVGQKAMDLGLADRISTLNDFWSELRSDGNRWLLASSNQTQKETGMSRVGDLEASRPGRPAAETPPAVEGSGGPAPAAETPPSPAPAVGDGSPPSTSGAPRAASREEPDGFEGRVAAERRQTALRVARGSVAARLDGLKVPPALKAAGLEEILVELTAENLVSPGRSVKLPDGSSASVVEVLYGCLEALPKLAALNAGELAGDDAAAARRRPVASADPDSDLSPERVRELDAKYHFTDEPDDDGDDEEV